MRTPGFCACKQVPVPVQAKEASSQQRSVSVSALTRVLLVPACPTCTPPLRRLFLIIIIAGVPLPSVGMHAAGANMPNTPALCLQFGLQNCA
jgi:hypothetical protein